MIMKQYKNIAVLVLFIFALPLFTPLSFGKESEIPDKLGRAFISQLIENGVEETFDNAFSDEIKGILDTSIENGKTQLNSVITVFGEFEGYEAIRKDILSERLYRMTFLLYTKISPIVLKLYYYKTDSNWELISFSFDTEFEDMPSKE